MLAKKIEMMLCYRAEKDGTAINIYDGRGESEPIKTLKLHSKPISVIKVRSFIYSHLTTRRFF